MAMARLDPAVVAHLEWLGFVQPTGLVVSATALVRAGAILDRSDIEGSASSAPASKSVSSIRRTGRRPGYRISRRLRARSSAGAFPRKAMPDRERIRYRPNLRCPSPTTVRRSGRTSPCARGTNGRASRSGSSSFGFSTLDKTLTASSATAGTSKHRRTGGWNAFCVRRAYRQACCSTVERSAWCRLLEVRAQAG